MLRAAVLAVLIVLAVTACGSGSKQQAAPPPKPQCPATKRSLAKLDHDLAALRAARSGAQTDTATDRFLLDVATAPISNLQRNRLIDHAAAIVAPKCEQCFMALESARPIPSIRAGDSKCPTR